MENKQTALEWFEEQYMKGTTILPILFQQAKQMEKEQIIKALIVGTSIGFDDNPQYIADKYYKLNYENENNN